MFNDASEYSQSINNAVQRQSSVANAREAIQDKMLGVLKAKDAVIALSEGKWDRIGDMTGQGLLDAGIRGHGMQYYSKMIGDSASRRFRKTRVGKAILKKIAKSKIGQLGKKGANKLTASEQAEVQRGVDEGGVKGGAKAFAKITARRGKNWFSDKFKKSYEESFGADAQDASDVIQGDEPYAKLARGEVTNITGSTEDDFIDGESQDPYAKLARGEVKNITGSTEEDEDLDGSFRPSVEEDNIGEVKTRPSLSQTEAELTEKYRGQFGGVRDLTEEESITRATGFGRGSEVKFDDSKFSPAYKPREYLNDTTQGTEDEKFFTEFRRTGSIEKPVRQRGESEGEFRGRVSKYNEQESNAGRKPFVPNADEMREPTYTEQNQRETLQRMMAPDADHEDAEAANEQMQKVPKPQVRAADESAAQKEVESAAKQENNEEEERQDISNEERKSNAGKPAITPEEEENTINKEIDGNNEDAETGGGGDGDDPFAGILPLVGDAAIAGIGMGIMAITNWITGGRAAKEEAKEDAEQKAAMIAANAQAMKEIPSISTQFGV